ncbi:hypothetical protein QBC43DRAFT_352792, partial [Cladorrhinum sp. PSN259]
MDPKMTGEFHFFPLLPWELREKIWKLAIRPALPGVHVFRVYDAKDSEQSNPEHEASCSNNLRYATSRLAAPRCLPRGVGFDPAAQAAAPISWTINNPSTYLIDSGLWTACKQSLLVIEKEFQDPARREKVWSASELQSFGKQRARFDPPEATTYEVSDNSRRRYLTVFPGQDLFILQARDITAVDWNLAWHNFPKRHMAVEYNPAGDKIRHYPQRARNPCEFIDNLSWSTAVAEPFTLWFIDYRIKRNPRYQKPSQEQAKGLGDKPPRVFYASDRRFVEVKERELGCLVGHERMWDGGYEVSGEDFCFCCGADEFVDQLEFQLDIKWDYDENDWVDGFDYNWIEYGLLACE